MPPRRVKGGWRWGNRGTIYRGKGARKKALKQGRAIHARRGARHRARK